MKSPVILLRSALIVLAVAALSIHDMSAQSLHMGIFFDPLVGWYSSDNNLVTGEGSKAGFATGVSANWYFKENYAFSTGFTYLRTGGVQSYENEVTFLFSNFTSTVVPGEKVSYVADYFILPIGMKLKSNQIGYFNIFTDFGLDPGILNRGKISIPSLSVVDESATKEISKGVLGFHIQLGAEYSLGGTTLLNFGIGYEGSLSDVTIDNSGQPNDKTKNRIIRLHLGLFF